ncbi:DUF3857 domain-containing protein [Flavobacterium salilacus subsp. salilacus]|uniref:DUF3857 domain-containing protein n=1 Tax=Flavobacterium TaxID=237 RepID=UPI00107553DD|nr:MULTISPECIES: DUF3857 domain-containing protein [Flavobacterium]KAF2519911.1 DUF3857 domain-containing protein [Flavobacterium salilacus subsp. salilacus]MBE1614180.1 DUF3857 domain-containing protein [Flavobacterium sp. SaA2.13]
MFLRISLLFFFLAQQNLYAQYNVSIVTLPDTLKENANAVIRFDEKIINISSKKSMTIETKRIITVLNEHGVNYINAAEFFDNSTHIKAIEAVVYDSFGKEIKKIKKKDFKERSISEGSIITDNRLLYLDYTPIHYPFTVVYTSKTETSNTAFIPRWMPIEAWYISTEKATISITCASDLGFKYKTYNFDEGVLKTEKKGNTIQLTVENLPAYRYEDYSPSLHKVFPNVLFSLTTFNLEGVEGEALNWESFGTWMYHNLLTGTDELPKETIAKVQEMTAGANTPLEKAKIIYQYMQNKTRYISIQLGIGGWKPMLAKDVDRLGYGDCKALTNYTRALLHAAGVEAYYAVIYGDRGKRDIKEDFVSMQGNHVILAIPDNNELVWLECTSQQLPFGFQGDFTDDRTALLVKPEKSCLVRTSVYNTKKNTQFAKGEYTLTPDGAIIGSIKITSAGLQYDDKYSYATASPDDLDRIYKNRFSNINNLKLKKTELKNELDTQEFIEDISIEAGGYGNRSGNRIIFAVNAFNQSSLIPQRYRDRKMPMEIRTGFYDVDEVSIKLPEGFAIEAKPDNVTLTDKFGEYKAEYVVVSPNEILYKRSLMINNGLYDSADYENYRLFREKIARNDNAKMVLVKN